jgi:SAM-dependent methyltransferase
MVTTFETIEHIPNYAAFVQEIFRVLKPDGTLVLSTPNALVTNPQKGKPANPFHVYEFEPDELSALLKKYGALELAAGQTVSKKYGVAPFLPSLKNRKLSLREKMNGIYWKILLRMPAGFRNFVHKLFFGFPFYPGEKDYTFIPENLKTAHVQYFICRKKRN